MAQRNINFVLSFMLVMLSTCSYAQTIRVGSKVFNESYILAEMAAQILEHNDFIVERQIGLGGH